MSNPSSATSSWSYDNLDQVTSLTKGVNEVNSWGTPYETFGNNSNTVFIYILVMLGSEGQIYKATAKRRKAGLWDPWAPGIGMPTYKSPRGRVPWGKGKFPKYIEQKI